MNAASLRKLSDQAAKVGEAAWPGIIGLAGQEYEVEVGRKSLATVKVNGGTEVEGELVVKLRKELCPEKPSAKSLRFEDRDWKVMEVTGEGEHNAVWVIECEPKN